MTSANALNISSLGTVYFDNSTNQFSADIITVQGNLTNSQIKNLHASPVQIISAPGANKVIIPLQGIGVLNYGGTNAFTASANQTISVYYNAVTTSSLIIANNTSLPQTSNYIVVSTSTSVITALSNVANLPIMLFNTSVTEIGGNAANNNTFTYYIKYYILSL